MSLQYAILGLLNDQSLTGYDLKKMFDNAISNFWAASLSQIYRELSALEKKEYLTSEIEKQSDRPDKRIYRITEQGKTAFQAWITEFPEKLSKDKRDEFTLRIFFGSNLTEEELAFQFQRFIEEKRGQLAEVDYFCGMAEQYVGKMRLFRGDSRYWKFILRRARMNLETSIQWAEECIQDLLNREMEDQ